MHILYSAALALTVLLTSPWWLWQMLRSGKYRAGLGERLGQVPARLQSVADVVWVHAVSVGEVLAMSTIIARLRESGHRVVVSTTTDTGQKLARERLGAENVFYFPLDFAFAVRPWLRALKPQMLVLAEAEFWPNVLRLTKASGARIAVVNARISDRSFPRYRRFRGLMRRMLANVDVFLAQSEQDAQRLIEIGAVRERVSTAGNLKFDVKPPAQVEIVPSLWSALTNEAAGPVIVAGSTLAGEEDLVLAAFGDVVASFPKAVLVLAPRHPERFGSVADLVVRSTRPWIRRSEWKPAAPLAGKVLLLDSIGELAAIYELADVAFVGGSLVPSGGHNIVEPARFGKAVMVGPHTQNFREIVETFQRADAVVVVESGKLSASLLQLLTDDVKRNALGARAAEVVGKNAGATGRIVDALQKMIASEDAGAQQASQSARISEPAQLSNGNAGETPAPPRQGTPS